MAVCQLKTGLMIKHHHININVSLFVVAQLKQFLEFVGRNNAGSGKFCLSTQLEFITTFGSSTFISDLCTCTLLTYAPTF